MEPIDIARVCHEANRAYCAALGDFSQPLWAEAPTWQVESAVAGVNAALANPNAKPSDSHDGWLRQKEEDGWVYGPVKDPKVKQHPCMVPFEDLPPEQQTKDRLFQAVVQALKESL